MILSVFFVITMTIFYCLIKQWTKKIDCKKTESKISISNKNPIIMGPKERMCILESALHEANEQKTALSLDLLALELRINVEFYERLGCFGMLLIDSNGKAKILINESYDGFTQRRSEAYLIAAFVLKHLRPGTYPLFNINTREVQELTLLMLAPINTLKSLRDEQCASLEQAAKVLRVKPDFLRNEYLKT